MSYRGLDSRSRTPWAVIIEKLDATFFEGELDFIKRSCVSLNFPIE